MKKKDTKTGMLKKMPLYYTLSTKVANNFKLGS